MNPRREVCFLASVLAMLVQLAVAQGTFTQFDVPGSSRTEGLAIDAAGDLTGLYIDAGGNWHGFLFSGGAYTTIDYPGATFTYPNGINDLGQIVGFGNPGALGFVYDVQTQTFTTVTCPHALETLPYAINNKGAIAGTIGYQGFFYGFELVGTRCSHVAPPGNR